MTFLPSYDVRLTQEYPQIPVGYGQALRVCDVTQGQGQA